MGISRKISSKVRILGKSLTLIQSYRVFYCRVEACSPVVLIKNCPTFLCERENLLGWFMDHGSKLVANPSIKVD